MKNSKNLSIEGLRGILALIVCTGHFGIGTLLTPLGLGFHLHYAVDLFFVISGFVLAKAYYFRPYSLDHFLIKRFARLYPLHLLTLLIMMIFNFWQAQQISWATFTSQIFLTHNILPTSGNEFLNFPSWSISVEWWTSIAFFILAQGFSRKWVVGILGLYLLSQFFLCAHVVTGGDYEGFQGWFNQGLIRGLGGTSVGILVYLVGDYFKKSLCPPALFYASLFYLGDTFLFDHGRNDILFYMSSFFLISTLVNDPKRGGLLQMRPLVFLGTISYSIYLLHIPLYHLLQTFGGDDWVKGWQGKMILLPALITMATVSYYGIEQWMSPRFYRRGSEVG